MHSLTFFCVTLLLVVAVFASSPIQQNIDLDDEDVDLFAYRSTIPESIDCVSTNNPDHFGCGSCNVTLDCSNHGICSDSKYCICDEEHWGYQCQKTRKSKLTAFLLTLLVGPIFGLPPGAGRFYLGYTGYGVAQIILGMGFWIVFVPALAFFVGGIVFCGCGIGGTAGLNGSDKGCFSIIGSFFGVSTFFVAIVTFLLGSCAGLAATGWWFGDWIMILTGQLEPAASHGPFYNDF